MIIIECVWLGLYSMVVGVDKLFSVLFGPGRFLVYAFIIFMLALPAIQKTVSWQRYRACIEDIQHKLQYGNLSDNEIWFLEHNYNNIVEYMIKIRKWDVVKRLKKLKREDIDALYEYMLECARVDDKAIKQIYGIR